MYVYQSLHKFIFLTVFTLAFALTLTAQDELKASKLAKIDSRIQALMDHVKCPGVSIAVVQKNRVVYTKGFGYRNVESKAPVTANTLFAIGSCTKSFTATLIGQLEGKELLDLDASPRDYLPNLEFYNNEMNEMITVRDMLCHRTGLPRHDLSWYFFPSDSRDSLVKRIQYHEPVNPVRRRYQYNNFMYMTAGVITEELTQKSWEENIREQVFSPLEMNRSNLSIAELNESDNVAIGYHRNKDSEIEKLDYHPIRGMAPAGAINSSANDMANYLMAWINDGVYKEQEVIPSNFVFQAISAQVNEGSGFPGKKHPDVHSGGYGFGWSLSSYRGHYRVEHGGNIDGFTASICFFPTDSIGIVVLANQNFSGVPSIVRNILADEVLGLESESWDAMVKKKTKKKKSKEKPEEKANHVTKRSGKIWGTQASHKLEDYTGKFSHPGYGNLRVAMKNDSLFVYKTGHSWWLRHHHYDVFEPMEIKNGKIDSSETGSFFLHFSGNIKGEIDGIYMNLETSLDPMKFEREFEAIAIEATELVFYVGEYDLGGALAKVFIKEEMTLMLLVPGQPEYTLLPSGKHKFSTKELDGYSMEFVEKEGEIVAMKFVQPNGIFEVPKTE